jgi:hypothetical protein
MLREQKIKHSGQECQLFSRHPCPPTVASAATASAKNGSVKFRDVVKIIDTLGLNVLFFAPSALGRGGH